MRGLLLALGLACCWPVLGAPCAARARPPNGVLVKTADGGALFQADGAGSGLVRRALGMAADGAARVDATLWNAGEILTGNPAAKPPQVPREAPAARRIYTSKDEGKGRVTIAFEWAGLSAPQRALLDAAPGAPLPDGLGGGRLDYLRGERGREIGRPGGIFRPRTSALGYWLHGGPLYVGAPSAAVGDSAYAAFYERYKKRRAAAYLGASDGMLHAFDAADGVELFAYIPDLLMASLNQIAASGYAGGAVVDGVPAVGEALSAAGWRTVLVSGLGAGAPGVFALDVSDPARFEAALWEFGERDDPAIGKVTAAPAIAKFRVALNKGVAEYRHFAVVPGAGTLFLLALDKPPALPWRLNVNYFKLTPPAGEPNALGPAALVWDAGGAVRYAYAGDLQGNLWRFDFSGAAPWVDGVGFGAGQLPLFVARDKDGAPQPITQRPQVAYSPGGGYLILFGTGRPEEEGGVPAAQPQSFYAIRDATGEPPAPVAGRAALAARGADGGAWLTVKGAEFRYDGAAARAGWYLDLPNAEMTEGGAVLAGGKVFFNTAPAAGDACAAPGGRTYALDALSGLAAGADGVVQSGKTTGHFFVERMRGAPLIWAAGTQLGPRDATRRTVATTSYRVLSFTADGVLALPGAGAAITASAPAGRLSWREVLNWRELHEAATKPGK
jgi:type IV pilus assembly protein PilY1